MGNCHANVKAQVLREQGDDEPGRYSCVKDDGARFLVRSNQVIPVSTTSSGRTTPDVTSAGALDSKTGVTQATSKILLSRHNSSDKLSCLPEALTDLTQRYSIKKELRRGHSGRVHVCIQKGSGETVACKSICKKATMNENSLQDLRSEVEILRHLSGHPNILDLKEVYEDKKSVHLITEYCEEGDLADFMQKVDGTLSENSVAILFKSIVEGVNFCHSNGVVHRDLKPDNFLLKRKAGRGTRSTLTPHVSELQLKVADFGFATPLGPGQKAQGFKGTKYFFAPEMLGKNEVEMAAMPEYGFEVDIWALGVVLFVLLTGSLPFQGTSDQETYDLIRDGQVSFEKSEVAWTVSNQAEMLVKWMLQHDPPKRPTATQLLAHPWLSKTGGNDSKVFMGKGS